HRALEFSLGCRSEDSERWRRQRPAWVAGSASNVLASLNPTERLVSRPTARSTVCSAGGVAVDPLAEPPTPLVLDLPVADAPVADLQERGSLAGGRMRGARPRPRREFGQPFHSSDIVFAG